MSNIKVRRGVSLVEINIALLAFAILISTSNSLVPAIWESEQKSAELVALTRDGQVLSSRIQSAVGRAHSSPQFSGVVVVKTQTNGVSIPNALIVWLPQGTSVGNYPVSEELIIFGISSSAPNELLEIRLMDSLPVPLPGSNWQSFVTQSLSQASWAQTRSTLTSLISNDSANGSSISQLIFTVLESPAHGERVAIRSGSAPINEAGSYGDNFFTFKTVVAFDCRLKNRLTSLTFSGAATVTAPF